MQDSGSRTVAPPPLAASVLDVIGNTPLVALDRLVREAGVEGRVLAKLEHLQPGLSKKSRPAVEMLTDAKADGSLRPEQTVVELTSGNTGTGLAIACGVLGHPFVAVMSEGNSMERARMMAALGAEVVLVPQAPGSVAGEVSGADLDLVDVEAERIVSARDAFRADQFTLPAAGLAHERWTGEELLVQTGGELDAFVDFVGSGGSFGGVMRALRRRLTAVRGYIVEPDRADHPIQGGGYGRADLPLLEGAPVHGRIQMTGERARDAARLLARTEGIFGGYSTGANVAAALELLAGPERGSTIVVMVCDSGLKYLSTDLYESDAARGVGDR